MAIQKFLRAGQAPTLFGLCFYFAFLCSIWLNPAQKGLMLSVPIIAGALLRFPLGSLWQHVGRKNATLVEMALIAIAMLFGFFKLHSFNHLLAMGVLLGIAGTSFGVALSLGSGWFPPHPATRAQSSIPHSGIAGVAFRQARAVQEAGNRSAGS